MVPRGMLPICIYSFKDITKYLNSIFWLMYSWYLSGCVPVTIRATPTTSISVSREFKIVIQCFLQKFIGETNVHDYPIFCSIALSREIIKVISTLKKYLSKRREKCYFHHLFRGKCPPQPHTLIMLWYVENGRTISTILMSFKSMPISITYTSAISSFFSSTFSYMINVSREEYEHFDKY